MNQIPNLLQQSISRPALSFHSVWSQVAWIWILVVCPCAFGDSTADGIAFFEQKIRPILAEHCYGCHSAKADKLKGNLHLDSFQGWKKGGDSGVPAIVPNNPEESLLIRSIRHLESGLEMPPNMSKLPDAVVADFVSWIQMGAPDPRSDEKLEPKRGDKSWWSLQPIRKTFTHTTIDGFIGAKLNEHGLNINPPADPRSLIRRVSYDLTGLPPTPTEVIEFTSQYNDSGSATDRQSALEKLVDRLLASPRYGERWGRHWLDVVRFGESIGFERNVITDDLYPFRDYVIQSINEDKPFNQIIVEHLAGDVLDSGTLEQEIGSAFLVAGPYDDVGNQDIAAKANIRAATLDDMITATSSAFLGLSIHCARCHHHKFDPIPTEDYYRLRSAFEGTTHGRRVVATQEQRTAHAAAMKPLREELKQLESEKSKLDESIDARAKQAFESLKPTRPKIDPAGTEEIFPAVEAKHLKLVIHAITTDGAAKIEAGPRNGRLTEVQVWSPQELGPARNVALASNGTVADGAKSATAEDFPEAYGPQYCIDGKLGEAWFIGNPAVLKLTFRKLETISAITIINARGDRDTDDSKVRGGSPCEYEIQVSIDGEKWRTVASNEGREAWSLAHGIASARRSILIQDETTRLEQLKARIAETKKKIGSIKELPQMWVGIHDQPKEGTFVHKGGDPMKPTDPVLPSGLSVLDQAMPSYELAASSAEGERRLKLARWITSDENPLTARVLANRVWQYHFGSGIVDTPSDFGFLGSQPSHPELLDYLAYRLIQNSWKLKALHREILLSHTYRQSSAFRKDAATLDKDSRWLWRCPPRRLSAEEIRDTILTVAGQMKLEPMGGPGFRLYKFTQNNVCTYIPLDQVGPETYRRSVYHQNARASVVDVLSDFDLPDIAFSAPKRVNTTTPLQAMTLLNHSFSTDMARALSRRLDSDSNKNEADFVRAAYRLLYQREPTPPEMDASLHLLQTHGQVAFCRGMLNTNELIYLD